MRIRVLLIGRDRSMMDEFFYHMGDKLECQSSSVRKEDLECHVRYFNPQLLALCLKGEKAAEMENYSDLIGRLRNMGVPYVLVGNNEDCELFQRYVRSDCMPRDVLKNSMAGSMMADRIVSLIFPASGAQSSYTQNLTATYSYGYREQEWRVKEPVSQQNRFDAYGTSIQDKRAQMTGETPVQDKRAQMAGQVPGVQPAASEKKGQTEDQQKDNRRKHVTVIDDDPMMLKVIKEYLHEEYEVAVAVNGKIAQRFLENKTTDCILLDYVMPGEDGPEIYKKIRALPQYADTPIVFLTGMSEKSKIKAVMALHPQGYVLKPVEKDKLLDILHQLI